MICLMNFSIRLFFHPLLSSQLFRHFEEQAEGVLDECYREDEQRAQHLIDRELYYYGMSSVILLSAEGESIRFMAHPCCQDFLNSTWMGKLSPKNSLARVRILRIVILEKLANEANLLYL